jgi:RHS repeat-associated protein
VAWDKADFASSSFSMAQNTATVLTWNTPAPILYGTALGSEQMNATANVEGSFVYSMQAGTVLPAGQNQVQVIFTPVDTVHYSQAQTTVTVTVNKATPFVKWPVPAVLPSGTPLTAAQLNATAAGINGVSLPGNFVYSTASGTVVTTGSILDSRTTTLSVAFTPNDSTDYTNATKAVTVAMDTNPSIITTVAGNGTAGYNSDGIQGIAAELNGPTSVAIDSAGNIYIADTGNSRIRKVSAATGIVQTIAGNGTAGYNNDGILATNAELNHPQGVAVDSAGNIYIADTQNNRLRKVNATTGVISTITGSGTYGCGNPFTPVGVAVDSANNVYIGDSLNNVVLKLSSTTNTASIVVNGAACVYDYGPGYGSNSGDSNYGDGGPAIDAGLNDPMGIAVSTTGNFYVADMANYLVREVSATTGLISSVAGQWISGAAGQMLDGGAQSYSCSTSIDNIGDGCPATTVFLGLTTGVAVDSTGDLYLSDGTVRRVTASTGYIYTVAGLVNGPYAYNGDNIPATSAELNNPQGLAVDQFGNLYIADTGNNRIRKVTPSVTTPTIKWHPLPIVYGTPLSAAQLNASANVAGTYAYSQSAGTVLAAGSYTLTVTFTPTDGTTFSSITASAPLTVYPATPGVAWPTPANIAAGTQLSPTQLDASAIGITGAAVSGTYTYTPATGVLGAGTHVLSVSFTSADPNYTNATATTYINVVTPAGSTFDTGTVALVVNGSTVSTAVYGAASTPSTIAATLAANAAGDPLVNVTAVNDALSIQATATGPSSNYAYSIQTTSYNASEFSQPSFVYPEVSGSLNGGANQSATNQAIYSYTVPSGGYDGTGNLLNYTDSVMGTWSFSYDTLNRLLSGSASTGGYAGENLCWSYDPFGNRTAQVEQPLACPTLPAVPTPTAAYNTSNQATWMTGPFGTYGLSYDAAGNVTDDAINQYLYDAEGRVCAVKNYPYGGVVVMTGYVYDASGQRVSKGTITAWSCDPAVNGFRTSSDDILGLSGEQVTEMSMDANGTMAWQHTNVYAGSTLLGSYDTDGLHFYFDDPLGTRRAQTDYAGTLEQLCSSLPYGDALACTGSTQYPTEHHFTGKERDSESGLDYFGARYYGSSMGRFMSPDSPGFAHLSNPQAWNLYSYTYNNPLSSVDPDGHDVACTYNISQCVADANKATGANGQVVANTTVTHHSFLGIKWDTSVTKLGISGDEASFRALGQDASRLADLIDNHSFTLEVRYAADPNNAGGSDSFLPSQGNSPLSIIDPNPSASVHDPDALDQNIPQANTAEEFGHEVLGHEWGELINGDAAGSKMGNPLWPYAPTTRANMRDSITGENAVRKLDPTRGQKAINSHHNYPDAPSDGFKK